MNRDTAISIMILQPGQNLEFAITLHSIKTMQKEREISEFDTLKIISDKDTIEYDGKDNILAMLKNVDGGHFIEIK